MPRLRAKFACLSVQKWVNSEQVKLLAVTKDSEENKAFWDATPSGQVDMSITNSAAFGSFEPGAEYYLDFTLVEPPIDPNGID